MDFTLREGFECSLFNKNLVHHSGFLAQLEWNDWDCGYKQQPLHLYISNNYYTYCKKYFHLEQYPLLSFVSSEKKEIWIISGAHCPRWHNWSPSRLCLMQIRRRLLELRRWVCMFLYFWQSDLQWCSLRQWEINLVVLCACVSAEYPLPCFKFHERCFCFLNLAACFLRAITYSWSCYIRFLVVFADVLFSFCLLRSEVAQG